eukprot:3994590-Pyramimonas_sp.AAC.1
MMTKATAYKTLQQLSAATAARELSRAQRRHLVDIRVELQRFFSRVRRRKGALKYLDEWAVRFVAVGPEIFL